MKDGSSLGNGVVARVIGKVAGLKLSNAERKEIRKAGSIKELKAIVVKMEGKKGFFARAAVKSLKATISKAESKQTASEGGKEESKSDGEGDGAKGESDVKSEAIKETITAKADEAADDKYNGHDPEVIRNIAEQTGMTEEEVIEKFNNTREATLEFDRANGLAEGTTFNNAIALLKQGFETGLNILNCASEALFNTLGGAVSQGVLALQALCAEIAMGNFSEANIKDGQVYTSLAAVQAVENQYGRESSGYSVDVNGFVQGLQEGDKAVIWVDGNHYITVIKNSDGTVNVIDPNKNNGQAMTFTADEFKKLMNGAEAIAADGKKAQGYSKVTDANGEMKVLTDAKRISEIGHKLDATGMKNIMGAKGGPFGGLVSGITKAFKSVVNSVKKIVKSAMKAIVKVVYNIADKVFGWMFKGVVGQFLQKIFGDFMIPIIPGLVSIGFQDGGFQVMVGPHIACGKDFVGVAWGYNNKTGNTFAAGIQIGDAKGAGGLTLMYKKDDYYGVRFELQAGISWFGTVGVTAGISYWERDPDGLYRDGWSVNAGVTFLGGAVTIGVEYNFRYQEIKVGLTVGYNGVGLHLGYSYSAVRDETGYSIGLRFGNSSGSITLGYSYKEGLAGTYNEKTGRWEFDGKSRTKTTGFSIGFGATSSSGVSGSVTLGFTKTETNWRDQNGNLVCRDTSSGFTIGIQGGYSPGASNGRSNPDDYKKGGSMLDAMIDSMRNGGMLSGWSTMGGASNFRFEKAGQGSYSMTLGYRSGKREYYDSKGNVVATTNTQGITVGFGNEKGGATIHVDWSSGTKVDSNGNIVSASDWSLSGYVDPSLLGSALSSLGNSDGTGILATMGQMLTAASRGFAGLGDYLRAVFPSLTNANDPTKPPSAMDKFINAFESAYNKVMNFLVQQQKPIDPAKEFGVKVDENGNIKNGNYTSQYDPNKKLVINENNMQILQGDKLISSVTNNGMLNGLFSASLNMNGNWAETTKGYFDKPISQLQMLDMTSMAYSQGEVGFMKAVFSQQAFHSFEAQSGTVYTKNRDGSISANTSGTKPEAKSSVDDYYDIKSGDNKVIFLTTSGRDQGYGISAKVYTVTTEKTSVSKQLADGTYGILTRNLAGGQVISDVLTGGKSVYGDYAVDYSLVDVDGELKLKATQVFTMVSTPDGVLSSGQKIISLDKKGSSSAEGKPGSKGDSSDSTNPNELIRTSANMGAYPSGNTMPSNVSQNDIYAALINEALGTSYSAKDLNLSASVYYYNSAKNEVSKKETLGNGSTRTTTGTLADGKRFADVVGGDDNIINQAIFKESGVQVVHTDTIKTADGKEVTRTTFSSAKVGADGKINLDSLESTAPQLIDFGNGYKIQTTVTNANKIMNDNYTPEYANADGGNGVVATRIVDGATLSNVAVNVSIIEGKLQVSVVKGPDGKVHGEALFNSEKGDTKSSIKANVEVIMDQKTGEWKINIPDNAAGTRLNELKDGTKIQENVTMQNGQWVAKDFSSSILKSSVLINGVSITEQILNANVEYDGKGGYKIIAKDGVTKGQFISETKDKDGKIIAKDFFTDLAYGSMTGVLDRVKAGEKLDSILSGSNKTLWVINDDGTSTVEVHINAGTIRNDVTITSKVDFKYEINAEGVPKVVSGSDKVKGYYTNADGREFDIDAKFGLTAEGISINGKIIVGNDKNKQPFVMTSAGSGGGGGQGSAPDTRDASDTKAKIISEDGRTIITDGTISLRDGKAVIFGDKAIALTGSQLMTEAGGLVTLHKDHTMINGQWRTGTEFDKKGNFIQGDSTNAYSYNDGGVAAAKAAGEMLEALGYSSGGIASIENLLKGPQSGNIPTNGLQIIENALRSNGGTGKAVEAKVGLDSKGNEVQFGGVALPTGIDVLFKLDDKGNLGLFAVNNFNTIGSLPKDYELMRASGIASNVVNLEFKKDQQITLANGLINYFDRYGDHYITNSAGMKITVDGVEKIFEKGDLKISTDKAGNFVADLSGRKDFVFVHNGDNVQMISAKVDISDSSFNIIEADLKLIGVKVENTKGEGGEGGGVKTVFKGTVHAGKADGILTVSGVNFSSENFLSGIITINNLYSVGSEFYKGSDVIGHGKVKSGTVRIVSIDANGQRILVSVGGRAEITSGSLKSAGGLITEKYNEKGCIEKTRTIDKGGSGWNGVDKEGNKLTGKCDKGTLFVQKFAIDYVTVDGQRIGVPTDKVASSYWKGSVTLTAETAEGKGTYNFKLNADGKTLNYNSGTAIIGGKTYQVKNGQVTIPASAADKFVFNAQDMRYDVTTAKGMKAFTVAVHQEIKAEKERQLQRTGEYATARIAELEKVFGKGNVKIQDVLMPNKSGFVPVSDLNTFLKGVDVLSQPSVNFINEVAKNNTKVIVVTVDGREYRYNTNDGKEMANLDRKASEVKNREIAAQIVKDTKGLVKDNQTLGYYYDKGKDYTAVGVIDTMKMQEVKPGETGNFYVPGANGQPGTWYKIVDSGPYGSQSISTVNARTTFSVLSRGENGKVTVMEGFNNGNYSAKLTEYHLSYNSAGEITQVAKLELAHEREGWIIPSTVINVTQTTYSSIADAVNGQNGSKPIISTVSGGSSDSVYDAYHSLFAYGMGKDAHFKSNNMIVESSVIGDNRYSYITLITDNGAKKDKDRKIQTVTQYQTVADAKTGFVMENSVISCNVNVRPDNIERIDQRNGQTTYGTQKVIDYYANALKNGNADIIRYTSNKYNNDGSIASSFNADSGGRAYVDRNGVVQAVFNIKDSNGQSISSAMPTFYTSLADDLAFNAGAKSATVLSGLDLNGITFGGASLNNMIALKYDWDLFTNSYTLVDLQTGKLFYGTQKDKAYYFRAYGDNDTEVLRLQEIGDRDIKLSLFSEKGDIITPKTQISISHNSFTGLISVETMSMIDPSKNLIEKTSSTLDVLGNRTNQVIQANTYEWSPDKEGNIDLGTIKHFINISGYYESYDRNNNLLEKKEIGTGSLDGRGSAAMRDIKWDEKGSIIQYIPQNYQVTQYKLLDITYSDGTVQQEWRKTSATILDGGKITNISSKDDRYVLSSSSFYNDITFKTSQADKKDGWKVESYSLVEGVREVSYAYKYGLDGEMIGGPDGIMTGDKTMSRFEVTYNTQYSSDGVDFSSSIEGNVYASKTRTDTISMKVEEKEIVNGEYTGKTRESTKTIEYTNNERYSTVVTNYYGVRKESTLLINGNITSVANATSETVVSGYTQTVITKDEKGYPIRENVTSIKDITTLNYSDGSSKTVRNLNSESTYSENTKTQQLNGLFFNGSSTTTEFGVQEIIHTDKFGNSTTIRTFEKSIVTDSNGRLLQKAENGWTYTAVVNMPDGSTTKSVVRETDKTINDTYKDSILSPIKGFGSLATTTILTNTASYEYYIDNKLIHTYSDNEIKVIGYGMPINSAQTKEFIATGNITIREGREIYSESFNYTAPDGTVSDQAAYSQYTKVSYDYIGGTVAETTGRKDFIKEKIYEDGIYIGYKEIENIDRYTTKTYEFDKDSDSKGKLNKIEEGYSREYDINVADYTRTSRSESFSQVADYENGQFYIVANTNIFTKLQYTSDGKLIDKEVSGTTKRWDFASAESVLGVNFDGIKNAKGYWNDGMLNAQQSYSYTNKNFTQDAWGRETGYDFTRTYFAGEYKGKTVTGRNTTEYVQYGTAGGTAYTTYSSVSKAYTVDGVPVNAGISDGKDGNGHFKVLDQNGGYFANSGVGNTSAYKSIESSNIMSVYISNIAAEMLSDGMMYKNFAKMMTIEATDTQKGMIKVAVGAAIAVAVVVTTVLTCGLAASAWLAAFTSVSAALKVAFVIGIAGYSAYFAYNKVGDAVDHAYEGQWGAFAMDLVGIGISFFGGGLASGAFKIAGGLKAGVMKLASGTVWKEGFIKSMGMQVTKESIKDATKLAASVVNRAAVGAGVGMGLNATYQYINNGGWDNFSWSSFARSGIEGALLNVAWRGSTGAWGKTVQGFRGAGFKAQAGITLRATSFLGSKVLSTSMIHIAMGQSQYAFENGNYVGAAFNLFIAVAFSFQSMMGNRRAAEAKELNAKQKTDAQAEAKGLKDKQKAEVKELKDKQRAEVKELKDKQRAEVKELEAKGATQAQVKQLKAQQKTDIAKLESKYASAEQQRVMQIKEKYVTEYQGLTTFRQKFTYHAETAAMFGVAAASMSAMMTISGNLSQGKNPFTGLDMDNLMAAYTLGAAFGLFGSIVTRNTGSFRFWSQDVIGGTLAGLASPATMFTALGSAAHLATFNAVAMPMLHFAFDTVKIQLNDTFNTDYFDTHYKGSDITEIWGKAWGDYTAIFSFDVSDKHTREVWAEIVASGAGMGGVVSPFFGMALPAYAFGGRIGNMFVKIAESGNFVAAIPGVGGLVQRLGAGVNTAITLKQFELAEYIGTAAGGWLDDRLGMEKKYQLTNGEMGGFFAYSLGAVAMLLVPSKSGMKALDKAGAQEYFKNNPVVRSPDMERSASRALVEAESGQTLSRLADPSVNSIVMKDAKNNSYVIDMAGREALREAAKAEINNRVAARTELSYAELAYYAKYGVEVDGIRINQEILAGAMGVRYAEADFAGKFEIAKQIDELLAPKNEAANRELNNKALDILRSQTQEKENTISRRDEFLSKDANNAERDALSALRSLDKDLAQLTEALNNVPKWNTQERIKIQTEIDKVNTEHIQKTEMLDKSGIVSVNRAEFERMSGEVKASRDLLNNAERNLSALRSLDKDLAQLTEALNNVPKWNTQEHAKIQMEIDKVNKEIDSKTALVDMDAKVQFIRASIERELMSSMDFLSLGLKGGEKIESVRVDGTKYKVTAEMREKSYEIVKRYAEDIISQYEALKENVNKLKEGKGKDVIVFEEFKLEKLKEALNEVMRQEGNEITMRAQREITGEAFERVIKASEFAKQEFSPELLKGAKLAENGITINNGMIEKVRIDFEGKVIEISEGLSLRSLEALGAKIENIKFTDKSSEGAVKKALTFDIKLNKVISIEDYILSNADMIEFDINKSFREKLLKAERDFMMEKAKDKDGKVTKDNIRKINVDIENFRNNTQMFTDQFSFQREWGAVVGKQIYEALTKTYGEGKVALTQADMLAIYKLAESVAGTFDKLIAEFRKEINAEKEAKSAGLPYEMKNSIVENALKEAGFDNNLQKFYERLEVVNKNIDLVKKDFSQAERIINEFAEKINRIDRDADSLIKEGKTVNEAFVREQKLSVLEELRTSIKESKNGEEGAYILRRFVDKMLKDAVGFEPRASQSEMISAMLRGENVALGMGGGKTVSAGELAVISRIILGKDANIEILVGNGDLNNYTGAKSEARKLADKVGLKMVSIEDIKVSTDRLAEAYADHNSIVVMDPTTRGHLRNQAISSGDAKLNKALNSVNRVFVDEIHRWTLERTAAVIGGDNKPPEMDVVLKAAEIVKKLKLDNVYREIIDGKATETTIKIETSAGEKEVTVKRYNTIREAEVLLEGSKENVISVIGETTADRKILMTDSAAKIVESLGYKNREIDSVMRGMFGVSDKGGLKFGADGRVKPVGEQGVQENMVISDIYYQLGYALQRGIIEKNLSGKELADFASKSTQTSNTSMQTSLAAIYDRIGTRMVGMSGTVAGLEQLISNRAGSPKVHDITGESVNTADFRSTSITKSSEYSKLFDEVLSGKRAMDNVLTLAKTADSNRLIREAIMEKYDALTKAGYKIYEFNDRQGQWKVNEKGEIEVERLGKDKDGNDMDISYVAKNSSEKRIIIANEMGATGIDYQGKFANIIFDAHLMSNTDLAQAIKRTGRPGGDKGRWDTDRYIVNNYEKMNAQLEAFVKNDAFVDYARKSWTGESYLNNEQAALRLKVEMREKLTEKEFGRLPEHGIRLANETGEIVKFRNYNEYEAQYKTARLSAEDSIAFVSNIRDLYDINSSIQFSVSDTMRDRMVINPLRQLTLKTSGADKERVMKTLNDVLNNKMSEVDFRIKKDSGSVKDSQKIMKEVFDRTYNEALTVLKELKLSDSVAKNYVKNHIEDMKIANKEYNTLKANKERGLDSTRNMSEFVEVMKSLEDYMMPEMARMTGKQEQLIAQAEKDIKSIVSKPAVESIKDSKTSRDAVLPEAAPMREYSVAEMQAVKSSLMRSVFALGASVDTDLANKLYNGNLSDEDKEKVIRDIINIGVSELYRKDSDLAVMAVSDLDNIGALMNKYRDGEPIITGSVIPQFNINSSVVDEFIGAYSQLATDLVYSLANVGYIGEKKRIELELNITKENIFGLIAEHGSNWQIAFVDLIRERINNVTISANDKENKAVKKRIKEVLKDYSGIYTKAPLAIPLLSPVNNQQKLDKLTAGKQPAEFSRLERLQYGFYQWNAKRANTRLVDSSLFARMFVEEPNTDAMIALMRYGVNMPNTNASVVDDKMVDNYKTLFAVMQSSREHGANFDKNYNFKEFDAAVRAGDYVKALEIMSEKSDTDYYEMVKGIQKLIADKNAEKMESYQKFSQLLNNNNENMDALLESMKNVGIITMSDIEETVRERSERDNLFMALMLINPEIIDIVTYGKLKEYVKTNPQADVRQITLEELNIFTEQNIITENTQVTEKKAETTPVQIAAEAAKLAAVTAIEGTNITGEAVRSVINPIDANGLNINTGEQCLLAAADALGKVNPRILAGMIAIAAANDEQINSPADMLRAAGIDGENALRMGILNEVGLNSHVILPVENLVDVIIPEGSAGFVAYLNTEKETGHAVAVVGIDAAEKTITIIDNAAGKKTISMDEFKQIGFEGLIWVDKNTAKVNTIMKKATEANSGKIVEAILSSSMAMQIEVIRSKFAGTEEAKAAGEKLIEKVVEAYASPEELKTMVLIAVAAFKDAGEMEEYLGLKGSYNKQQVAEAAMNKIGEAIFLAQQGDLTPVERDQEIALIRVVADMLMAASEDAKVKDMIKNANTMEAIGLLQQRMSSTVPVNRYVVAEAMAVAVRVDNNIMKMGKDDFEINIAEIKMGIETGKSKFELFGKKDEAALLIMIGEGRGKEILSPVMRLETAKRIAAAA
ncbi:MAG: hypothetical protein FWG57_02815 [Endomicrobia bacterium]|nr:hypothetical protein [Endomicrobiia bacterium]